MTYAGLPAALHAWILEGRLPRPVDSGEAEGWVSAAAAQGLAGLLGSALRQAETPGWPPAALERLRNLQALSLRAAVCQGDAARRIQDLLGARGIRSLPLKGAALNTRLYDSPSERPMGDVDVLVLDRWPEALAAVEGAGWRAADEGDHAVALEDPRTGTIVELHHSVTSCPGFHPLDANGLWERSRPAPEGGRTPCAEDLFVQIALHAAFQHGLAVSAVQLVDVRRLLERQRLDLGRVKEIAAAARAEAAVGATLRVAQAVVGAPVSDEWHRAFIETLPPGLARWIDTRLSAGTVLEERASALLRARWELAAGRRLELVRRTLSPASARRRERGGVGPTLLRAGGLVRRWGFSLIAPRWAERSAARRV